VALGSTVYNFDIDLADADRGVYETLPVRAARHPSESEEFLVARLLAYCLEYEEGIEFSRGGLSDPDDPPIAVKDLTGVVKTWIDIGTPAADRLHRASKSTPRVAVYNHKDSSQWLASLKGARIHKVEELEVYAIERALVAALVIVSVALNALTASTGGAAPVPRSEAHRLPASSPPAAALRDELEAGGKIESAGGGVRRPFAQRQAGRGFNR